MAKSNAPAAVVNIGGDQYVVTTADAAAIFDILNNAQKVDSVWGIDRSAGYHFVESSYRQDVTIAPLKGVRILTRPEYDALRAEHEAEQERAKEAAEAEALAEQATRAGEA